MPVGTSMMQVMLAATETHADGGLIRAAAAGDRAAFGALYSRYARMVHGILLSRVPPVEAEDLMHDVFLTAMNRLGGLRDAAAFPGWIAAIARRRAIDYHRANRENEPLDERTQAGQHPRRASREAFEILDAIRGLPEAYRETLVLRLVEGMTGPEIARETGLTPDSVRVNLCRGMKLLRARLGHGEEV